MRRGLMDDLFLASISGGMESPLVEMGNIRGLTIFFNCFY